MMVYLRPQLLLALLGVALAPLAAAADPGVIERVRFDSKPDRLDFVFTASTPIDGSLAEVIPARGGEVLILRLGGITARRQWITTEDPAIFRTLLHPSTDRPPGAILRVRFRDAVITRDLVKDIQAEYAGDDRRTVLISVPRPPAPEKGRKGRGRTKPEPPPPAEPPPPEDAPPEEAPEPPTPEPPAPEPADSAPEPMRLERDVVPADPPPPDPASDVQRDPTPTRPVAPSPPPADPPATPPAAPAGFEAIIAPPDPQTGDVRAGLDGLVDRLRLGMAQRPGVPRVAVLPFAALDPASRAAHLDDATTALIGARLTRRAGLVQVDPERLRDGLAGLHRGDDGRFALDDARALAEMLGADTLLAGAVATEGDAVIVSGRAIDARSGRDLGLTRQPLDAAEVRAIAAAIREEQTVGGTILRSALLPGLGQIHQGHTGRGAGYLTAFVATLGAGAVSAALGASAEADYHEDDASTVSRRDDADAHYARATAFFVGAGAVWLASLVDAMVTAEDRVVYDLSAETADAAR